MQVVFFNELSYNVGDRLIDTEVCYDYTKF